MDDAAALLSVVACPDLDLGKHERKKIETYATNVGNL